MNASQLKYARERADRIKRDRINANVLKFAAKILTDKERIALLRAGNFSIKRKIERVNYVSDIIQFPGEAEQDKAGLAAAQDKVEKDFRVLMDELVLGDNEAALELLRAFAAAA